MSKEQRPQNELSDPLVSRTYRDLSDEHAPEHLDHVVLNEARSAAIPEYTAANSWLRPAAWVTTIGLCLAIVLEVSDMAPEQSVPGATTEVGQKPSDSEEPVPAAIEVESFDRDDRQLLREADDRARMQTGSDRESVGTQMQVAPATGLESDAAMERYCEESETGDPNDWLDCILALEQQGLLEAAKAERDLLFKSFPDAPSLISR
jgi:hypothetical protein